MQLHYYFIGETAGKIYRRLEQAGSKTGTVLQKEVGVTDSALFNQALGWLSREGKIHLEKKGRGWEVSLLNSF